MSLRQWQAAALTRYQSEVKRAHAQQSNHHWLLEACPGAGKTRWAGIVLKWMLDNRYIRRVIVCVPSAHLRQQWAEAMQKFYKINLDCTSSKPVQWAKRQGCHGCVVTYAMIAKNPQLWIAVSRKAIVVGDEIHHTGVGASWGDGLATAFEHAPYKLNLSGTPFRSDNRAIPGVTYDKNGKSQPDFTYGLEDGTRDNVIRHASFVTYGGEVQIGTHKFDFKNARVDPWDTLSPSAGSILAKFLEPKHKWLTQLLENADQMLTSLRIDDPRAGGLVTCINQEHARDVANLLYEITGVRPIIVLSDTKTGSRDIKRFANSAEKWLVSVRMVSEGIDIPRLRVGVYATNISTPMYFRQFLGRITRVTRQPTQMAYCYMPADNRFIDLARDIMKQQRHCLKFEPPKVEEEEDEEVNSADEGKDEVSAENTNFLDNLPSQSSSKLNGIVLNGGQLTLFPDLVSAPTAHAIRNVVTSAASRAPLTEPIITVSEYEERAQLLREINTLVSRVVHKTKQSHASVRASLNRQQRVSTQSQCNNHQLKRRVEILNGKL